MFSEIEVNWIIGIFLIFLSLLAVYASITRVIHNFKEPVEEDDYRSSSTPFVCSLLFFIGYSVLPIEFSYWSLLFFLLDVDTIMLIFGLLYLYTVDFVKGKNKNI